MVNLSIYDDYVFSSSFSNITLEFPLFVIMYKMKKFQNNK